MMQLLAEYRREVYFNDDPYEIYCVDLLCAVIKIAFNNSSWVFLPEYSDVALSDWLPYLKSKNAISILWPSQQLICRAGILKGQSAIVQLPTGVGKTKSIELILRAAFLSNRANIAIIVAPLRALCNEITVDMLKAFNTSIRINQFSDVLQNDYELDITDSTEQGVSVLVQLGKLDAAILRCGLWRDNGHVRQFGFCRSQSINFRKNITFCPGGWKLHCI